MASTANLEIRPFKIEDVKEVMVIEEVSFPDSSWSYDAYCHEIEHNEYAHYFVLTHGERILGYIGMWVVIDQAQITTIAVDPKWRGCGYGELLMQYAMNLAKITCEMMSLEVRIENNAARKLYEKLGFSYGGVRKDYYGPGLHAEVMWVRLKHD